MAITSSSVLGIPIYDSNRPGEIISPTIINAYSALTLPAYWRAINFLADNLASFPRAVHQNGSPADATHPLNRILRRRPNQYQNATQFWRTLFAHTANYGNGYARIARKGFTAAVDSLHNLLPEDVWPFRYDAGDGQGLLQYYFVKSAKAVLTYDEVIHLSALSYDGMKGHDVVWMHRESLQRGLTLDKYLTRYLQRGTVLRGSIEIPAGISSEQEESLTTTLRRYFQGADSERDVIVLSDGAKLNNSTLSPQDSQLIQQGAYTTKQIAQITGVPPQFLYEFTEQKYNGTSIESIGQDVVRYTFRPWIEQIEDELTIKLLTDAEQDQDYAVNLDPAALLRGDTATLTTTTVAKVGAGLATPNEGRRELSLPPSTDPEADKLKRTGDTAPPAAPPAKNSKQPGEQFAKAHINLAHFSDLIADAAARVHTKTAKATEAAQKKHEGNAQGWTAWANTFAADQGNYAAVCISPVLTTYANLSGKPVSGMADKIGKRYSRELGQHLMKLGNKVETTPPDLAAIVIQLGGNNGPEPTISEG